MVKENEAKTKAALENSLKAPNYSKPTTRNNTATKQSTTANYSI